MSSSTTPSRESVHWRCTILLICGAFSVCPEIGQNTAAAEPPERFEAAVKQLSREQSYSDTYGIARVVCTTAALRLGLGDLATVDIGIESEGLRPLVNPFLMRALPTCLVVSVFDQDGRFLRTVPELTDDGPSIQQLVALEALSRPVIHHKETMGVSLGISAGPISALHEHSLVFDEPGEYILQANCSWVMFADFSNNQPITMRQRQELASERYYRRVACRSTPIHISIAQQATAENRRESKSDSESRSPISTQLTSLGVKEDGRLEVELRVRNVSQRVFWLYEPVMSHRGRAPMAMRFLLTDQQGTVRDFADAWTISYTGPLPSSFIEVPPNGFLAKKLSIPRELSANVQKIDAIYHDDLFVTPRYAEIWLRGSTKPSAAETERNREERPRFKVVSNTLHIAPSGK